MPALEPHHFREAGLQLPTRQYGVFLARGNDRRYESIVATTRDRAADMLEKRLNVAESEDGPPPDPPWRAIAISIAERFDVAGRCDLCHTILCSDEPHQQAAGRVRCGDGCRQW